MIVPKERVEELRSLFTEDHLEVARLLDELLAARAVVEASILYCALLSEQRHSELGSAMDAAKEWLQSLDRYQVVVRQKIEPPGESDG